MPETELIVTENQPITGQEGRNRGIFCVQQTSVCIVSLALEAVKINPPPLYEMTC